MSHSIPINLIDGNLFAEVLARKPAVVVVDARNFRLPTIPGDEREHWVEFDSAEVPTAVSCTCAVGARGEACWAMARALDVWRSFTDESVFFWPRRAAREEMPEVGLHAFLDEAGGLNLTTAPPVRRGEGAVMLAG